jgi:hypothetical protein
MNNLAGRRRVRREQAEELMLGGIQMFAPFGGVSQWLSNPPTLQEAAHNRVEHLKDKVDNGEIDLEKLQARLQFRFGDAANGVVGDDGSVDFKRLEDLIVQRRAVSLQHRLESRFGDAAKGIVGDDGTIDAEKFVDLVIDRLRQRIDDGGVNLDRFQQRLEQRFGDAAAGVVGDDGTVDYDKLKNLILGGPSALATTEAAADPAPQNIFNEDGSVNTNALREFLLDQFKQRVTAGQTDTGAFQDQLTAQFGDAAAGIVGNDGSVDFQSFGNLVAGQGANGLRELLSTVFGDAAQGVVREDGTIDAQKLAALVGNGQPVTLAAQSNESSETASDEAAETVPDGDEGNQSNSGNTPDDPLNGLIGEDGQLNLSAVLALLGEPPLFGHSGWLNGGDPGFARPDWSLLDFQV